MSERTTTGEGAAAASNEYEREPVPQSALLGFRNFLGVYAGENIAGTELMIGPLFVAAGVSAFDLILGLLVGNVLAVASWMLMTAPIAVRARLTLYYHLERICGRRLVTLYNLANGLMFCFLAGAMITISATAVGVLLKFPMPALSDTLPNSLGWCAAVLAVGFIIAAVAAKGYRLVAWVGDLASPWMVFVFLGFGIVGLKEFLSATGLPFQTGGDVWRLFSEVIWKGGDPLPGQIKFTFWHVVFFAWFCNMAVHVGMSDLSLLRYARKSWYSVAAAAGMYLGHFMAWICAAVLYALQLHLDKANVTPLPGPMASTACGLAGLACVVVAGWTTANPTIYRAGLAFQAVMPKASRVKVTFVTGMLAAAAGMFPAVTMKLLDFVALYGLLLMPMGAVLFMDFWALPRLGLRPMLAAEAGLAWNAAAAWSWFGTLAACLALVKFAGIPIFFVGLPGWFIASAVYVGMSRWQQGNNAQRSAFNAQRSCGATP
jgi:purine-cytosine permease-like protein